MLALFTGQGHGQVCAIIEKSISPWRLQLLLRPTPSCAVLVALSLWLEEHSWIRTKTRVLPDRT